MIVIDIQFISGKYHATPWGRNVNEGVTEYPPSPFRIFRAIIDSWKRKGTLNGIKNIEPILEKLSETPEFFLPKVTTGTTASYLNSNDKQDQKSSLIYDSFISINPEDAVKIIWRNGNLSEEEKIELDALLRTINYLGRSESWVSVKLSNSNDVKSNCLPTSNGNIDTVNMKKVAVPISKQEYITKYNGDPSKWLENFFKTTNDMKKFERPYTMKYEYYVFTETVYDKNFVNNIEHHQSYNSVLYQLNSSVLPLITETLNVAEKVHVKLLGIYKKIYSTNLPTIFTGIEKDNSLSKGHKHIYILPLDMNNDGRLDHILIKTREVFDSKELYCLDVMDTIWQSNGKPDIELTPVKYFKDYCSKIFESNIYYISQTPFIPTQHYRKGRGNFDDWLKNQINLELSYTDMPEPLSIEILQYKTIGGLRFYWLDYNRSRKGDPVKTGYGFKIKFQKPINMPFSLGYASHFGLGLFVQGK